MFLRRATLLFAPAVAALLAGCATPPPSPLPLQGGYFAGLQAKGVRVGVAMSKLPAPDTSFPGAHCLLCYGIASGVHSSLTKAVQAFDTAELKALPGELAALLSQQGVEVVLFEEPIDVDALPKIETRDMHMARTNFGVFKARFRIDRLIVVHVTALGVARSYSGYVPQGPPRAEIAGSASLVNLETNALEWYQKLDVGRGAEGPWDEPPSFPGLTNAYYQVLEEARDRVKGGLQAALGPAP